MAYELHLNKVYTYKLYLNKAFLICKAIINGKLQTHIWTQAYLILKSRRVTAPNCLLGLTREIKKPPIFCQKQTMYHMEMFIVFVCIQSNWSIAISTWHVRVFQIMILVTGGEKRESKG